MEKSTTGRDESVSKLHDIKKELKSLRAAVIDQNDKIDKFNTGIANVENQLASLSAGLAKIRPTLLSQLRRRAGKAAAGWYVRFAPIFLRANAGDLFDREYYISRIPGLGKSGIDPVFHYLLARAAPSPHWLFDSAYYLSRNPDVAAAKVDPLVHFLRAGWREGRNPHPLFQTDFYLGQAPELRQGQLNPVTHYLQTGWLAGLKPHRLFDGRFYLARYPDLTGINPLKHYILFGAGEARQPHPWFDVEFYRERSPDVAQLRVECIQHYVEHGAREGRNPHPLFDTLFYQEENASALAGLSPLEHFVSMGELQGLRTLPTDAIERFLPVTPYVPPPPLGRIVDIIVPVYRGLAETRACIESVLASRNREPFQLTVIDDCSPDPALSTWLREGSAAGLFTLLSNRANLGFVETVNRGMSLHPDRDVLLLNSDTTVANDWLDRLVRCAYQETAEGRVGTATPFSNNATICSYPRFCEDNPLPPGATPEELDRLAAEVNQGRSVSVPTAVGFCMYIRRECLRDAGLFNVEAFRKGYGEENDFSCRAAARGWRNVLAADVFVHHVGSVSFSKSAALLRESGVRTVAGLHPDYLSLVARHVSADPALPFRFALTAARFRHSRKPVILLVTHDLGGGIAQHIEELGESLRSQFHFLLLQPAGATAVMLCSEDPADGISLRLYLSRQYHVLLSLLRSCGVARLHVHHVLRHELPLEKLRHDLDVPMDFTVHDYFTICPRIVLADPEGRYCGEPDEAGCNICISTTLPHLNLDIASWRSRYAWLINSADRVIAPSVDAAARMLRYFPVAHIQAAAHPAKFTTSEYLAVQPPFLEPGGILRVAVLGVMSINKGLRNLERCAQIALDRKLPVEFTLVGYCEPQLRDQGPFPFTETGEYDRADLPAILNEVSPGLVWFPAAWPETFSYTLSTCLERGLPIAAPQLGAFPERLGAFPERPGGRRWTWTYEWDIKPEALLTLFLDVRERLISGRAPHPVPARTQADADFYSDGYSCPAPSSRFVPTVNLRERGRLSVIALLSSYDSGQMQSCGFIRAYLPLMHDRSNSVIRLTVTTPESALTMNGDVLLVQRTAVATLSLAEELVNHCERQGIRIVYETDDDLFNIQKDHVDSFFYTPLIAPAEMLARRAALVLVSSPVLKQRLAHLNAHIRVVPNALDEALWFPKKTYGRKFAQPASACVRILYMGTLTHSKDLELLEEPMRRIKAEFGHAVELDLVGIMPIQRRPDWFNFIEVPAIYGHSYPLFVEWIRKENNWDFGVAPLVDNDFNRCKSYIKYLDYAAIKLPGVFSAIGVFEDVVQQGKTGFCVSDAASWYEAMRLLITDRKLRRQMGEAAYRDVQTNHTLDAQLALRRDLWNQIGSLPAVRSNSTIVSFSEDTAAASSKGI